MALPFAINLNNLRPIIRFHLPNTDTARSIEIAAPVPDRLQLFARIDAVSSRASGLITQKAKQTHQQRHVGFTSNTWPHLTIDRRAFEKFRCQSWDPVCNALAIHPHALTPEHVPK